VFAFNAPRRGDLHSVRVKTGAVSIAAAPNDGYWITTGTGKVYPFAAPMSLRVSDQGARAPIVAIIAN
jgi:hypothetical protein